jgi:hypothetical protein
VGSVYNLKDVYQLLNLKSIVFGNAQVFSIDTGSTKVVNVDAAYLPQCNILMGSLVTLKKIPSQYIEATLQRQYIESSKGFPTKILSSNIISSRIGRGCIHSRAIFLG